MRHSHKQNDIYLHIYINIALQVVFGLDDISTHSPSNQMYKAFANLRYISSGLYSAFYRHSLINPLVNFELCRVTQKFWKKLESQEAFVAGAYWVRCKQHLSVTSLGRPNGSSSKCYIVISSPSGLIRSSSTDKAPSISAVSAWFRING